MGFFYGSTCPDQTGIFAYNNHTKMALSQVFSVSQNQAATVFYPSDDTGDYSLTNPGGYGSPNTARADLAILLVVKYHPSTATVALTVGTYDPKTVTDWTVTGNGKDGHFSFTFYSVARKTGSETPVLNNFVYDFTGNQLQRWNGSSWVSATTADLETNDAAHKTIDYPSLGFMFIAFNNLNKRFILGCKTMSRQDIQAAIVETAAMLNGTIALFAEGSFSQAQENIEKYASRVVVLADLT